MKTFFWILMLAGLHAGQAEAAPKPLKADYVIYSGDLSEQMPPTKSDRKTSINVTAQSPKGIFDAIGPDIKATCTTGGGERDRRKGTVWSFYQPGSRYECYFGSDLSTGRSIEVETFAVVWTNHIFCGLPALPAAVRDAHSPDARRRHEEADHPQPASEESGSAVQVRFAAAGMG